MTGQLEVELVLVGGPWDGDFGRMRVRGVAAPAVLPLPRRFIRAGESEPSLDESLVDHYELESIDVGVAKYVYAGRHRPPPAALSPPKPPQRGRPRPRPRARPA